MHGNKRIDQEEPFSHIFKILWLCIPVILIGVLAQAIIVLAIGSLVFVAGIAAVAIAAINYDKAPDATE